MGGARDRATAPRGRGRGARSCGTRGAALSARSPDIPNKLANTCSEGAAWGWLFDHALESWGANDHAVRREHRVFARDDWRCTVPGCTSYRNLHDHHVVFRSVGGGDDLANRTTRCAGHHLRGVHAGRVRVIGSAPDGLRFELGLRPGQPPLLRYRSGDQLSAPAA